MWRSIFLALGIMAIVIGAECLIIDSASLYSAAETRASSFMNPAGDPSANSRVWRPKEHLPWLLMAAGTITVLYSFTLPQRFRRREMA
ncbi:hypothetical protein LF1_22240 [Rubripirellula obstinata]|uniref:Uncharacterized protein n=1 Tax=Rubripirellula obstinata TaxID=406547 RepID=A0A5B1CIY6_9BACT|nr:hypothetical protein [Rubripirellula obstinata]KAA1259689.1 hypothetical protein LF1_22240 [Rubripirellula obstinata]